MGARRPAFALILVLLVVAAVFAMTMHSAVVLRSSIMETGAVGSRQNDLRLAQSAASAVLRGMTIASQPMAEGDGSSGSGENRGSGTQPEERLDLPPIVRQMLAAAGKEIEDQAQKEMDRSRASGGIDGAGANEQDTNASGSALLSRIGLPDAGLEIEIEGRRCVVELRDGLSGLNINEADASVLRGYLLLKGVPRPQAERIADQILDWRDEDSLPRGQGMEHEGYGRMGIVPRDGRFRSADELRLLPAMSERVFAMIRDDVRVAGDGSVHLGSASEAVLRAVGGLSEAQAGQLIALRVRGALTEESVRRIVDLQGEGGKRMRLEPSAVLSVRVLVEGDQREPSVFEGVAVVNRSGVASLGLRAARGEMDVSEYDG